MKKFMGLAVLVLGLAGSAHAQISGSNIGGSGTIGSGGGIGVARAFPGLASYPRATFATILVSGTDTEFKPSAFLSYDQAVAEGRAALAYKAKTVAEVAAESNSERKTRAKLALVQNANGTVDIVSQ
jgi:hypothetical protein